MNLEEKLKRSESTERIDFSRYPSAGLDDQLVKIISRSKLVVEPCWTIYGDWEGNRYRDYIAEHPEYDGVYVRSKLAKKLETAAESLSQQYQLVIRAGHRPIEVQRRLLLECADDYKKDHPEASDDAALEHARTFVSDPDSTLPPHVCGAAVDVELLDAATGKPLDFGSKMNDDSDKSFLHYPNLTSEQKNNRIILLRAMLDAGFASCMPEWWHFSYGDQVWAWFYGELESLYSPIDVADRSLTALRVLLSSAIREVRTNPTDDELFEGINLRVQGAMELPKTNAMHSYLGQVREELLGWEDVEAVLRHKGVPNIKDEAKKVRLEWCDLIEKVLSTISK